MHEDSPIFGTCNDPAPPPPLTHHEDSPIFGAEPTKDIDMASEAESMFAHPDTYADTVADTYADTIADDDFGMSEVACPSTTTAADKNCNLDVGSNVPEDDSDDLFFFGIRPLK